MTEFHAQGISVCEEGQMSAVGLMGGTNEVLQVIFRYVEDISPAFKSIVDETGKILCHIEFLQDRREVSH